MTTTSNSRVGAVVIGRNEGDRLERCLRSVTRCVPDVVYVDSASTDGSVERAHGLGVEVVELDTAIPFTAARARNAGFDRLQQRQPELKFVQFIDGDCQLVNGWVGSATEQMMRCSDAAVVCGRCRERFRNASIYNRLCDMEWDTPVGEARACGGNALVRASALLEIHGFDPTVIAAEDDELCVRLRLAGWKIYRIDAEMVVHDAAMTQFSQWWKRSRRTGHAYAQGYAMHGRSADRHFARELRSTWLWGAMLPLLIVLLAWPAYGFSLVLLGAYPAQIIRIYRNVRRKHVGRGDAWLYAVHCVAAKFPQMLGVLQFNVNRLLKRQTHIIEHRLASSPQDDDSRVCHPSLLP